MTGRDSNPTPIQSKDRVDDLIDEPCANPRYGGLTLLEVVRKEFLYEEMKQKDDTDSKDNVQSEL